MDKDYELKNIHPEEFADLLEKIESSFNIKFIGDELYHIPNFGALCDHIANKIQLENSDDCTTQQAFYKLRNAISSSLDVDSKTISPTLLLSDLFPKPSRRTRVKKLENYLIDFDLFLLDFPDWVKGFLFQVLFVSLFVLFFKWQIGLGGLAFSLTGFWLAPKISSKLTLKTVGQVAEKMAREHYLKSRRNPTTFNKNEIEKLLINMFSNDLDLDKSKLTREAKFV